MSGDSQETAGENPNLQSQEKAGNQITSRLKTVYTPGTCDLTTQTCVWPDR